MDSELRHLMKRLKVVLEETGGDGSAPKNDGNSGDSFMQLRQRVLRKTKEIEELCDERDANFKKTKKGDRSTDSIKRDQEIRKCVQETSEIMQNLQKIYKSALKGSKKQRLGEDEIAEKNELFAECMKEVQHAVERSKSRPGEAHFKMNAGLSASSINFTTGSLNDVLATMGDSSHDAPYGKSSKSSSSSIEMSSSVNQKLAQVQRNKDEMNKYLDVIEMGINELAEIANTFGEELAVQDELIKDVHKNIEKADDKINKLNDDTGEILKDTGQCCQNQALNLVCFIILIGLAGILIKQIGGSQ
jgi:methyl-accepting chemotaxis protein